MLTVIGNRVVQRCCEVEGTMGEVQVRREEEKQRQAKKYGRGKEQREEREENKMEKEEKKKRKGQRI